MNQTIEFKKDCIMKTYVSEITDINLTHDYKILSDTVEGYFNISGTYKITKSSVSDEEFMFSVPFTIALSPTIDRDTVNITLEDFKYSAEKDVLHLVMDINMEYKEIEEQIEEPIVEEASNENMEEEKKEVSIEDEIMNMMDQNVYHNDLFNDIRGEEKVTKEETEELSEDTTKEINSILKDFNDEKGYFKYKIYIMRREDTIESVAIKYNVSLDDLREYNNIESINVGDKIIIPYVSIDED